MNSFIRLLSAWILFSQATLLAQLPADCRQVIIGKTKSWQSTNVTLSLFQKTDSGWLQLGDSWSGRLGSNGLVWGRGVHPLPKNAKLKQEGDGRAPAGIFRLGQVWSYQKVAVHPNQKLNFITERDLWVDDPRSSLYNEHTRLKHTPQTAWEKKQQMRQNDHAHSLKLFIAHNSGRHKVPGQGSAIFFHIWRKNGAAATAGCTTMAEANLKQLIRTIDPKAQPHYVLLPEAEYQQLRRAWRLP